MTSVLNGIRVLDLSWGVAGPITGMLLSDNGADVVKVEPPGGDPFRSSPGYAAWLRGRRSAELDLTEDADRDTFLGLARSADIVLESFAPGTTARLGIDADTLLAQNPSLIYCSITGYGPHRGHRSRPAYDALVAARLGLLHEQRSPRRSDPLHPRRGSVPARPSRPRGDGTRIAPVRTDLHLHAVAEHLRRLPGHHGDQRRPLGPVAYRSRSARGDLAAPGCALADHVQVVAGRTQR